MILFVDDEERYIEPYLAEFRMCGYDPFHITDVDAARRFIEENIEQIEVLIADIMMQPGENFSYEETKKGLRTGIVFYREVRDKTLSLPIIILTNVTDREVSKMLVKDENCSLHRKISMLPFELVEEVQKILRKVKKK
jgi:DNA-binding response OmpR family regulator